MRQQQFWSKIERESIALFLMTFMLIGCFTGILWAQTPQDILVVAASGDIETIDPPVTSGAPFQHEIITNLYDFLIDFGVRKTETGGLIGDLNLFTGEIAKEFTVSADGIATFRLREGAKFADGTPITTEAVKYTYERIFGVKAVTAALIRMATVMDADHVTVVDPHTVQMKMDKPNPLLFGNMAQFGHAIVNPAQIKPHTSSQDPWATGWMKTHAAGAGAFVLERWTPGTEIVLSRNDHYWAGPAKLKQIVFKIVPDPSTRALLLRRGAVDMAMDLALQDITTLKDDPNVVIHEFPTTIVKYIGMNLKVKPFDQVKVRQAIAYAVPYETILHEAIKGFGRPLRSPVPAGMPSHDETIWMYNTNPQKAKELLAEAGFPDGFKTRLTIRAGFPVDEQIAVWVQSSLRPLGVEVEIEKLPLAGYTERLRKHEHAFFIHDWLSINNDPFYHYFWLFKPGCCNYGNYQNDTVTELISTHMLSTDIAARNEASRKVQKIILEDAPWIFLFQPNHLVALRKQVKGFIYYPDRYNRYYTIFKE